MKTRPKAPGWRDNAVAVAYLEALEYPVVVLDKQGVVQEGNGAFFSFTAQTREGVVGQPIGHGFPADSDLDSVVAALVAMSASSDSLPRLVTLGEGADGVQVLRLTGLAIEPLGQERLLAVCIETAPGQEGVGELTSEARTRSLERMNEELVGFSHAVAHDLRAPLRFIDKFAYLLLERYGRDIPPEALQFAEQIREGARQTAQLVEDLLHFSQVTGSELRCEHIDMESLVRSVIEGLQHEVEGRAVDFHVAPLGMATGDQALVRQVVVNLVDNAIKFTHPRKEAVISVTAQRKGGAVTYTVADNGVGFDAAEAPRMFEVFQRFHQPDAFEGSGVGLAVVKRIVLRHGGSVWADSVVGEGAQFYFTLSTPETCRRHPSDGG